MDRLLQPSRPGKFGFLIFFLKDRHPGKSEIVETTLLFCVWSNRETNGLLSFGKAHNMELVRGMGIWEFYLAHIEIEGVLSSSFQYWFHLAF